MKRLSCFAVLVVFCLSIFAISVNPSMDGRAVVADAGIFPPGGYYGRAPGYLPGDTVVVTNHNNGFSIDVLILGTYDAYEGIAILLSPEAADKLQIVKGKDVYVKVQKKQPISYEEAVATSRNKKFVRHFSIAFPPIVRQTSEHLSCCMRSFLLVSIFHFPVWKEINISRQGSSHLASWNWFLAIFGILFQIFVNYRLKRTFFKYSVQKVFIVTFLYNNQMVHD